MFYFMVRVFFVIWICITEHNTPEYNRTQPTKHNRTEHTRTKHNNRTEHNRTKEQNVTQQNRTHNRKQRKRTEHNRPRRNRTEHITTQYNSTQQKTTENNRTNRTQQNTKEHKTTKQNTKDLWRAYRINRGQFFTIFVIVFVTGNILESSRDKKRSIFGHFHYGSVFRLKTSSNVFSRTNNLLQLHCFGPSIFSHSLTPDPKNPLPSVDPIT